MAIIPEKLSAQDQLLLDSNTNAVVGMRSGRGGADMLPPQILYSNGLPVGLADAKGNAISIGGTPITVTASASPAVVGTTLTAVVQPGYTVITPQWVRDTGSGPVAISGATSLSYVIQAADVAPAGTAVPYKVYLTGTLSNVSSLPFSVPNGTSTSYFGQVATNTFIPDAQFNPNIEIGSRSPHIARTTMTTAAIVIPNWFVLNSATETNSGGTLTATASIEYPAGTFTRLTFGGANSGTAANGANLVSDSVAVNIPSGAKFWVRMKQVTPGGSMGFQYYAYDGTCQLQPGTTTGSVPDYTMGGGDWTAQTGAGTSGVMCTPAAIVANTAVPSIGVYGDSISVGRGDTNNGSRANTQGHLGRAFGATYPCGHVGVSGDTLQAFIAGNAKRLALAQYFSHIAFNMGINDVTGGRTAAQVQSDTNTILGLFAGKKIAACTLSPVTTSSDSWATTANQTLAATNSVRIAVNTQRKTTLPLANTVYDVNTAVENVPSPEDGKWTVVGGANTADGTHPNATGYAAEAAAINIALLVP